jgi:hypothetical protein
MDERPVGIGSGSPPLIRTPNLAVVIVDPGKAHLGGFGLSSWAPNDPATCGDALSASNEALSPADG